MKLVAIKLENFRSYQTPTTIRINDLTALIGRNDSGKSSILEAVGILLGSPLVKFDKDDMCVYSDNHHNEVRISGTFDDFPESIILDATAQTTLADEYLLNENGLLEICRSFDCSGSKSKESIFALAHHPTASNFDNLLSLSNSKLKNVAKRCSVLEEVDKRSNVQLRQAIWASCDDLQLNCVEVPLTSADGKSIWSQLEKELPYFAFFRADRPNTDEESEVQDPMKIAVKQALEEVADELETIKTKVQNKTLTVAKQTLNILQELDSTLANELTPKFKVEPKWDSIFKLSLEGDDGIPVNKRGSGVRRLVLFKFFFMATVEEQQSNIFYAIEEPETSQHPNNQQMLMETLKQMADIDGVQILLTTHVPSLASQLPIEKYSLCRDPPQGPTGIRQETKR